jgi:hypothetical protein
VTPTAQLNTRQSGAGLKILSAGSTLYGLRACAEMFGRERGIPVQVATDHIHQAASRGEVDADVALLSADMICGARGRGCRRRRDEGCYRLRAHRRSLARGRASAGRFHDGGVTQRAPSPTRCC